MNKLVVTEYVMGTELDLISEQVKLNKISPDIYYPTIQQPDKDEPLTEAEFKGRPMEEVRCWEKGKIISKFMVIIGEFAYDLE
jgi:hypothetical protein